MKNKTMTIFFTSDLHLGHVNIIRHCSRPFSSIEEMDNELIKRWNKVVTPKDTVYILGDFAFYKDQQKTIDAFNKLNGAEIHLIQGNHDKHMKAYVKEKFTSCGPYKEIYIADSDAHKQRQFIVLMHYAMRVFNKSGHSAIQLFGHSHGSLPGNSQQLDVGVDCWDYTPCSYEQIKEKLKTLPQFKTENYHENI